MNSKSIIDWLLLTGRNLPDMPALVSGLAAQLNAEGMALERLSSGFRTLHPEVAAMAYLWNMNADDIQTLEIDLETHGSSRYLMSPIRVIDEGGSMVRCRLEGDSPDLEYAFLEDMRNDGYTDYAVLPVPHTGNRQAPMTIATKRAGGFTDEQISELQAVLPTFGLLTEIHAGKFLARSLLDVYLGHGTGERVLAGAIRRGSVRRYPAAICFVDLRDFTALSERLPRNFIIHVLNDYFGAVGDAIEEHSGEILKFIGDAALAIFPVGDSNERAACDRAYAAAQDLCANLQALNDSRQKEDKPTLSVGVGMHVGEVWYGNIGSANRLDFTVIGPAVNRAARLETLAASLGDTMLVSKDFAEACSTDFDSAGSHPLKGIDGETEAFRPAG